MRISILMTGIGRERSPKTRTRVQRLAAVLLMVGVACSSTASKREASHRSGGSGASAQSSETTSQQGDEAADGSASTSVPDAESGPAGRVRSRGDVASPLDTSSAGTRARTAPGSGAPLEIGIQTIADVNTARFGAAANSGDFADQANA